MKKVTEAIVLAGGLGTRLRSAVPDLPKCMAPVAGMPFLHYVISFYRQQGIDRFIFSLGYRHEIIEKWLQESFPELEIDIVIEAEPLGTGGAVQLALEKVRSNDVLILNGDTLFRIDLSAQASRHFQTNAACTLALKRMTDFDRYGVVETRMDGTVLSFQEKRYYAEGNINGGVYVLNKPSFQALPFPEKFSFEKDFLENYFHQLPLMGVVHDGYFIDIGIPADYTRAQTELPSL